MIGSLISLICDEARRIWCFKWLAAATAGIIFLGGAAYVRQLPNVYDAWGQVFVDKQTPVAAATQGVSLGGENTGTSYFVQKTLLNDATLEAVVRRLTPPGKTMRPADVERAIVTLRRRIVVSPDQGDGFFEFHYRDTDPRRAHDIVQLVLNEFLHRNMSRNAEELRQAGKFLDEQIASYETMLADSQQKIAAFRSRNPHFVAPGSPMAAIAPAALPPSAPQVAYELAAAPARNQPTAPPRPSAAAERAAQLEAKLAALRTEYTDQHPDVIATKRQLAEAIAQRDAETAGTPIAASTTGDPSAAASLDLARRRLQAARTSPARVAPALPPPAPPEVQSEWTELERNDEVLRVNYQQLLTRREAARLSEAVDGAEAGKYQVTRRPVVPAAPVGPKRGLFIAVVAVAAIGGGLATAYVRAAVKGIFVSPRELEQAFQLPVVGTVAWEPAWATSRPRSNDPFAALGAALRGAVAAMTFRSQRKNVRGA